MSRSYNWHSGGNQNQDQLVTGTYDVLERTAASINRSNQVAIETEQIGSEVLSELSEQRESLLRTQSRLRTADNELSKTRYIMRSLRREVIYNKLILILIIILEIGILVGLVVIKFVIK